MLTEAYPESEYNLNPALGSAGDTGAGAAGLRCARGYGAHTHPPLSPSLTRPPCPCSVADLARGLGSDAAASSLRAKLRRLERAPAAAPLSAPLPALVTQRTARQAAYEAANEHVTRWQPQVKANREAATLVFPTSRDAAPRPAATTAALAAAFAPESALEMQVAQLLDAGGAATGAAVQRAETLELHAVSADDARERQARLAKMRALLFYHESKSRRIKAIKSKTYHRHEKTLLKNVLRRLGDTDGPGDDAQAAAASAEAQELARMRERFGLKHRNTSRWARRLIAKGIAHLPGTREALAEQLRLGEALRAKGNRPLAGEEVGEETGTDASSDEDSGGEEDDPAAVMARRAARLDASARATAMEVLAEGPEEAQKGLLGLPFMRKAQAKKRAQASADAQALLAELDGGAAAFEGAEDWGSAGAAHGGLHSGRLTFGGGGGGAAVDADADELEVERGSDEDEEEHAGRVASARAASARSGARSALPAAAVRARGKGGLAGRAAGGGSHLQASASAGLGPGGGLAAANAFASRHDAAFRVIPAGDGAPATEADGATRAPQAAQPSSKERRKAARQAAAAGAPAPAPAPAAAPAPAPPPLPRVAALGDEEQDPDALVGGVTARQRALIAAAFAGDDVAAEFAAAKAAEVASQLPDDGSAALASAVLPGWGAWHDEQTVPRAAKEAALKAKQRVADALLQRADAGKPHVLISERFDKHAAAYTVPALPFPFKSREAFEAAMRQPMSREVNTDVSFRNMTRPKVITHAGATIEPIRFRKVDPQQKHKAKQR